VGEPLCTVLVNDESRLEEALALIEGAFHIGPEPVALSSLVVERISASPGGSHPGPSVGRATSDRTA
jgi:hypothetical protein